MKEKGIFFKCGDWRLEREIGRGAYGAVYIASDLQGNRAAVKICLRDEIGEDSYERELRGAKLYSSIPPSLGLVRMRELREEEWGFCAVMDLADDEFNSSSIEAYRARNLARVIDGEKALSLNEAIKLGINLAKGLVVLQRHHFLHRDIKPANVIYVKGKPVLSDPGLVVEESQAATLVGTPGYIPPEKFTSAGSDVYSLGLTLKAASFGRKIEDLAKGPAHEADTSSSFFPMWWKILNKATDSTPARRYQSAKALLKDLTLLRYKIAVASILGLRFVKFVIGLIAFGLVVLLVFNFMRQGEVSKDVSRQNQKIETLNEFKIGWDVHTNNMVRRAKEDAQRLKGNAMKRIEELKLELNRSLKR